MGRRTADTTSKQCLMTARVRSAVTSTYARRGPTGSRFDKSVGFSTAIIAMPFLSGWFRKPRWTYRRALQGVFGEGRRRMRRFAIVLLVSMLPIAGGVFAQQKAGKDSVYEELNLFDEAFERIRQDAVDAVADTKLVGAAIAGMLSGLDPHSSFMDAAEFKSSEASAAADAASLGLAVTIENGQLKVISPQDGSPAARAGITPGDVIFTIDNEPTYDLS